VTARFLLWAFRMVVISFDETECLWCSFLRAGSWRFVGRNSQSCRMSTPLIWRLSLSCWMTSFVGLRWQDIHSANTSRSSGLSESSHCSFDWCSIHTVYVKFRALLGSLVRGVCGLSHSFRSRSVDGDHERYTKWLQSMCAVRWKAQAGEIVLAFCVG
jgi:transcription elongation factor Elf1